MSKLINEESIFGDADAEFATGFMEEPAVNETPPVEPEDGKETPPVEPPADQPPVVPDKNEFNLLQEVNKYLGREYKAVDELKTIIEEYDQLKDKVAKTGDYDIVKAKFEKVLEEYKKLDPKGLFSDDLSLKASMLIKENKGINRDVASKVFDIDLETSNPIDIITLDLMLKNKSLRSGEVAKNYFLKTNGIDVDGLDEMDEFQKVVVNVAAEKAAANILELRNSVTVPDFQKTIDEVLAEVTPTSKEEVVFDTTEWESKLPDVVKDIKTFEIKEAGDVIYSEAIDEDFKAGVADAILEAVKTGKIKYSKENVEKMIQEANDFYWVQNRAAITKRIQSNAELKARESLHKEFHNDTDPDKAHQDVKVTKVMKTDLMKEWGFR